MSNQPTHRTLRHRLAAWLALWSVVLGALLPALSHAVVTPMADGQGWVEVCTVSGMAWVRQADAEPSSADRSAPMPSDMAMSDCGWCATHAPVPGVPVAAQASLLPVVAASVPPAFLHAPRPLFVWAAAQSRAPPLSA